MASVVNFKEQKVNSMTLHSGLRGKKTPILIVTFCHENRLNQCFLSYLNIFIKDLKKKFDIPTPGDVI